MWPLALVFIGFGALVAWKEGLFGKKEKPNFGKLPVADLKAGVKYALNLYTVPGLNADQVAAMLMTASATPAPWKLLDKAPVAVKRNAPNVNNYTFSSAGYDNWIAYVQATSDYTLPRLFGMGGSDVRGIVQGAIDLTGMTPDIPVKVSGWAEGAGPGFVGGWAAGAGPGFVGGWAAGAGPGFVGSAGGRRRGRREIVMG